MGTSIASRVGRALLWLLGSALAASMAAFIVASYLLAQKFDALPDLAPLTDYRPKIPLRVYSADDSLIGEYGEERRIALAFKDIPVLARQAVLAAEDDRFYEHRGVDPQSVARAALNNARGGPRQGASTITQQLARNIFLTPEQTWRRKLNEALLAFKIERSLSKDKILEVYMNQIFLGQRAYGFASASQIYFAKPLGRASLAELAMLASLPKAPSAFNPVTNPQRARARQRHVLARMRGLGFIGEDAYRQALAEEISLAAAVRERSKEPAVKAEYVAEMARQFAFEKFGAEAYSMGLVVKTTVRDREQMAARHALRKGLLAYDATHGGYRGPEGFVELPDDKGPEARRAVAKALRETPDSEEILAAVVVEVGPQAIRARVRSGREIEILPAGFERARAHLDGGSQARKIRRGSVVRVAKSEGGAWGIAQLPEVSGALAAIDPRDGRIVALVGGFDFELGKFNRAAQAWRQPGSAFKPFVYSAALEKGFSPQTIVNDAPFERDLGPGQAPWAPKNYDGKSSGPISLRQALTFSKNIVSARVVEAITPQFAQEWAARFGFDPKRHPAVPSLALGAGAVTPLQMAGAYSAFAAAGMRAEPMLVASIRDAQGREVYRGGPSLSRALDERNAFVMDSLLRDVAQKGTAAKASSSLKRTDLAGKTGTTNDARDAWFAGYHPEMVAVAWMGFDQPKSLGARETGGGVALPMWIDFMAVALRDKPQVPRSKVLPPGLFEAGPGAYYFAEFGPGKGVDSLGIDEGPKPEEEENKIEALGVDPFYAGQGAWRPGALPAKGDPRENGIEILFGR